jgi:hypothetical protein
MDRNDQSREKPVWHSPEIVDVGGVLEATTSGTQNVRDNLGVDPPTYSLNRMATGEEVDLEGR